MSDRNLTSRDQETANTLNNYFSTVFEIEPEEPLSDFVDRNFAELLEYINIMDKDVEKILVALKPGKSQGSIFFHPKYIKETMDLIKEPLKVIFQKSLDENKLSPIWKQINVSAIFEKSEKKNPGNYRPISLTSVHCRLMEK